MTYIINPWYFYLANFLDKFQTLSLVVLVLAIIGIISFGIAWGCCASEDDSFEDKDNETPITKFFKKMTKVSVVATIISAIFVAVIPSEDTINKMMISSFVTKENVGEAKESAKELIDYIVEKAAELKKAEE